jgi:hypothetical protein
MGGQHISGEFGDKYRQWLTIAFHPFVGTADLCTTFFQQAASLLKQSARLGLLATNTISQGDTRQSGLAPLVRAGYFIVLANRFVKWPGRANVEVNLLCIQKGTHPAPRLLDGIAVGFISSRLDSEPESEPSLLAQNERKTFQGSILQGIGFVVSREESARLLRISLSNSDCLFPYLSGEDINSRPDQSPSRWVINFFDWPLERAEEYPELIEIVRVRVKPERDQIRRQRNRERWWIYAENRPGLYSTIKRFERVLVRSRVSELHMLTFESASIVFSDATVVFAFDDYFHFALLQSNLHEAWVWKNSSSLESRNRYTPTDCFETFAFPQNVSIAARTHAEQVGEDYYQHRQQLMLSRQLGLTRTYNLFHNRECRDEDIVKLRELHEQLDKAILDCYGWSDLALGHDFHANERGQIRFTISPSARRELLRRLLELNLAISETDA